MLSDGAERSRNPLKKSMWRRGKPRNVHFTDPTYYEPEDIDWSSEDEMGEDDMEFLTSADVSQDEIEHQDQQGQQMHDDNYADNTVQPLKVRGQTAGDDRHDHANGHDDTYQSNEVDPRIDRPRASEESLGDSGKLSGFSQH